MKYLVLLLLGGCWIIKPEYQVGQCLEYSRPDRESWEDGSAIEKILKIGKKKYQIKNVKLGTKYTLTFGFVQNRDYYIPIECPK